MVRRCACTKSTYRVLTAWRPRRGARVAVRLLCCIYISAFTLFFLFFFLVDLLVFLFLVSIFFFVCVCCSDLRINAALVCFYPTLLFRSQGALQQLSSNTISSHISVFFSCVQFLFLFFVLLFIYLYSCVYLFLWYSSFCSNMLYFPAGVVHSYIYIYRKLYYYIQSIIIRA